MTVFTIPERWVWDSSVRKETPYDKIVGLVASDQSELWLPDDPGKYMYSGGYHQGYSRAEAAEMNITLEPKQQRLLTYFVSNYLLRKQWCDVGLNVEAYDCHWFASVMSGKMEARGDTNMSLNVAERVVERGNPEDVIGAGQMGVIGACLSEETFAAHSYIGLPENKGLQVMGVHGPLAIAPQAETIQHYRETSDMPDSMGLYG